MMRKYQKSICVFVHELNRTGASLVMYDAISVMRQAGHGIMVISPIDGVLRDDYEKIGVQVFVLDEYCILIQESRSGKACDIALPIDSYIKIFNQIWCLTVVAAPIIKRYKNLNIPIVWWIHEGVAVLERYYRSMPKKLPDNVLTLVCSEYSSKVLKLYNFLYPVAVLHYGVKDEANNYKKKNDSKKFNFVMAGSLCPRKAQDILFEALHYVDNEVMVNSIFTIIGGGTNQEYLDKIHALADRYDNVRFIPNITREEVFSYYVNMDCLLCPSRDDPMPVVISEAAMFSKPVICSDFVGQAGYIEQANEEMVFKNLSPIELAKAINKIYYDGDLRKELGKYNRKIYEDQFAYESMKRNVLQIVNNL